MSSLIATVVGARPQFVKAAAVSREIARRHSLCEHLIHTGQHFDADMSQTFFEELHLPVPAENLGIHGGSHANQIGRMLIALEKSLQVLRPEAVLVYGDTNSTVAGALAAVSLEIPVGHVEAGLRSFNRCMPEEINRTVTDHVASLLFAPTHAAMNNLLAEGVSAAQCHLVGDVMLDVFTLYRNQGLTSCVSIPDLAVDPSQCVLATIHRAENTDDTSRLVAIFEALEEVARSHTVIVPLYPRTRQALDRLQWRPRAIQVLRPVGFFDMLRLQHSARLIVTDSGGIQKEAFFAGVPCAVLRTETEWVELVEAGWNHLIPPTDPSAIATRLLHLLARNKPPRPSMAFYGDGNAATAIVDRMATLCGA